MIRTHLALILLTSICVTGLRAQCDGCELGIVTYADGFFLGSAPIPGVAVSWTPDPTSHSGSCVGQAAPCSETPCKLGTGTIRVTVNSGTADVYHPDGAGQDSEHRAHLTTGNWAKFVVGKRPPINLECNSSQVTPLADIVTAPGTADEEVWKVSARCTSCTS